METPKISDTAWENAFNTLDKRVISAEAIGEYNILPILSKYTAPADALLDYGCGKGQMVQHLASQGYRNIWGTDPSELLIGPAVKANPNQFRLMTNSIPFPDATFKAVFCLGVLHHIDWNLLPNVLGEISRVLTSRGVFILIEPRQSIARSIGHKVVLSDWASRFKNVKALADCLRAEWPTYIPWIEREKAEFASIFSRAGFRLVERKNHLLTTSMVLEKR